jgi:hypothetical protein
MQRGRFFDIRVNFTVEGERSRVISHLKRWVQPVTYCGGILALESGQVSWPMGAAERYCSFLVLHELAHIVYAQRRTEGEFAGRRTTLPEESFCDEWALARVAQAK